MLDCRDFRLMQLSQHAFFQHYMSGTELYDDGTPRMLKVKDWPPEEHFRTRMVRHNQVRSWGLRRDTRETLRSTELEPLALCH